MSYHLSDLSVLSYAQGVTIWLYRAADIKVAIAPRFFTGGYERDSDSRCLQPGHMIDVTAPNGCARLWIAPDRTTRVVHVLCIDAETMRVAA